MNPEMLAELRDYYDNTGMSDKIADAKMVFPEPSAILMAGDWHGNTSYATHIIRHARTRGCDTIVHTGDYGYWRPGLDTAHYLAESQKALADNDVLLLWVRGNHEYHPGINEWDDATDGEPWFDKRYPNIIHLPNGYRWEWWGQTWLALGGAHSVDRLDRREGLDWWDDEHVTDAHIARSIEGGKVDVMVTHDCPTGVAIPGIPENPLDDRRGYFPMSELIASREHRERLAVVVDAVQPEVLVHGHYHLRYNALRRGPQGHVTQIYGLDCDGSSLNDNTILMVPK